MREEKKKRPIEVALLCTVVVLMSIYAIYKLGYEAGALVATITP